MWPFSAQWGSLGQISCGKIVRGVCPLQFPVRGLAHQSKSAGSASEGQTAELQRLTCLFPWANQVLPVVDDEISLSCAFNSLEENTQTVKLAIFVDNPRWQGRLLVTLAALLWSSSGVFVKASPVFASWPEGQRGILLAFWRAVFAAVVLLPFVRRPAFRLSLVPLGLAFVLMNVCYLSAMVLGTAANAIWLQYTAPAWVFVLSAVLFAERASGKDLIALGFAVAGVGLILACEFSGGLDWASKTQWGTLLGLASGLAYAAVLVYMRRAREMDAAWLVAFNHLLVVAALLPVVIAWGIYPNPLQLGVTAAFGTFQMGIPYLLVFYGLRRVSSQEAVLIGLIEPVVMPLWVYLAWGEVPAWWTMVGAVVILVGLLVRYGVLEGWPRTGPAITGTVDGTRSERIEENPKLCQFCKDSSQ